MAKRKVKKAIVSKPKTGVTIKAVKKIVDKEIGQVNVRIDRILLAIAKSKPLKGL